MSLDEATKNIDHFRPISTYCIHFRPILTFFTVCRLPNHRFDGVFGLFPANYGRGPPHSSPGSRGWLNNPKAGGGTKQGVPIWTSIDHFRPILTIFTVCRLPNHCFDGIFGLFPANYGRGPPHSSPGSRGWLNNPKAGGGTKQGVPICISHYKNS
jgi:hypothetical protein